MYTFLCRFWRGHPKPGKPRGADGRCCGECVWVSVRTRQTVFHGGCYFASRPREGGPRCSPSSPAPAGVRARVSAALPAQWSLTGACVYVHPYPRTVSVCRGPQRSLLLRDTLWESGGPWNPVRGHCSLLLGVGPGLLLLPSRRSSVHECPQEVHFGKTERQ